MQVEAPAVAPEEAAAAQVAGRAAARVVGLEPEAEVAAEPVELAALVGLEAGPVEELAARAAPVEQGEPGEQVVARVELVAEPEGRAGPAEATTTRTRMR